MNKLTNDENIKNLKTRALLRTIIMVLCLATVILSILSLVFNVNIFYALIAFLVMVFLKHKRESIKINKSPELLEIEKLVKKAKR